MIGFPTINPWVIVGALALLAASNSLAYYEGRKGGKAAVQAEWDVAKNAATEKKIDVKVKQDAIQNAPVSNSITARRLLAGTF